MNTIEAKNAIRVAVDEGYIADLLKNYQQLSRSQLIEATIAAQQGDDEAMRRVINSTTKLVLSVTRKVWLQWSSQLPQSAQFDDVYQAGLEGLYTAIQKFDYELGNTLTTMATLWIKQRAQRTVYTMIGICHIPERELTKGNAQKGVLLANKTLSLDKVLVEDGEEFIQILMGVEEAPEYGVSEILKTLSLVDRRLPIIAQLSASGYTDYEVGEIFDVSGEWIRQLRLEAAGALIKAGLA